MTPFVAGGYRSGSWWCNFLPLDVIHVSTACLEQEVPDPEDEDADVPEDEDDEDDEAPLFEPDPPGNPTPTG